MCAIGILDVGAGIDTLMVSAWGCLVSLVCLRFGRRQQEVQSQTNKRANYLDLSICGLVILVSQDRSSKGSGKAAGKKQESNVPWTAHIDVPNRDRHGDLAIRVLTQSGPAP